LRFMKIRKPCAFFQGGRRIKQFGNQSCSAIKAVAK
jgi:hypothetical protein